MKRAITYGRFNYLSKGHINFFETILKDWDELYVVILVNGKVSQKISDYSEDTKKFLDLCTKNVNKKGLLPIANRLDALSVAVKNNSKLSGKVHISAMCRPEVNVTQFNESYPAQYFDMVFPNDNSNEWDTIKKIQFKKVFFRPIFTVNPDFFTHNSDIINSQKYKEKMDPSAYDYYLKNKIEFK